jgi:hypothetical protein
LLPRIIEDHGISLLICVPALFIAAFGFSPEFALKNLE